MPAIVPTTALLVLSNVFMTFAFASWGIALCIVGAVYFIFRS